MHLLRASRHDLECLEVSTDAGGIARDILNFEPWYISAPMPSLYQVCLCSGEASCLVEQLPRGGGPPSNPRAEDIGGAGAFGKIVGSRETRESRVAGDGTIEHDSTGFRPHQDGEEQDQCKNRTRRPQMHRGFGAYFLY